MKRNVVKIMHPQEDGRHDFLTSPCVPRMPLDTITCIMEFLPRADLWRAASASREFRAAAHVAGLELHCKIEIEAYYGTSHKRSLATFVNIIDHLSRQSPRARADLALTLQCGSREQDRKSLLPVLDATARALPFLSCLNVLVPAHFCAELYAALAQPAPRLRILDLAQPYQLPQLGGVQAAPVPPSLFAGAAPRLAHVRLHGEATALSGAAIPVFARVRRVELQCCLPAYQQQLLVSASFPAARVVTLRAYARGDPAPLRTLLDISGLALHRLIVNAPRSALEYVRAPCTASNIEYSCDVIEYHEALWPAGAPDLCAHIRYGDSDALRSLVAAISTVSKDSASASRETGSPWSYTLRNYPFNSESAAGLTPLAHLPPLRTQLVSLTLQERLLPHLTRTALSLPALRELFVDCTVTRTAYFLPSFSCPPYSLCGGIDPDINSGFDKKYIGLVLEYMPGISPAFAVPALKTVTVFARTGRARTGMSSRKLAALGLALAQANIKPQMERPTLVLAGVQLDDAALPLLLEAYQAVCDVDSAEGIVPGYCDYVTDSPSSHA